MIFIPTEAEPEGSMETITGVELELSEKIIELIRKASALLLIHEEYDHIQLHIQTAFLENKSKLITDEDTQAEWRYDTELIRVNGRTFSYRAQGKWDSSDIFESQEFEVENLNKQTKWKD
jgi:hypothetical protein